MFVALPTCCSAWEETWTPLYMLVGVGAHPHVTPYATSYLRLGPSIVTTPEQVDAAVEAISTLA